MDQILILIIGKSIDMDLTLLPSIVLRTPALPLTAELDDRWDDLMELIRDNAPSFFARLNGTTRQQLCSDKRLQYTIWKYFSRSKYRATPFGSFASLSLVPLIQGFSGIKIREEMDRADFYDWSEMERDPMVKRSIEDRLPSAYQLNSTIYRCGQELRYINERDGNFVLEVVEAIPELLSLFDLGQRQLAREQIAALWSNRFALDIRECDQLLEALTAMGLLRSDTSANITGNDYFERMAVTGSPERTYRISRRDTIAGGLVLPSFPHLKELINLICRYKPILENQDLKRFKTGIVNRFGHCWMPLSFVIDPETGIGYGGLGMAYQRSTDLDLSTEDGYAPYIAPASDLERALLNAVIKGGNIHLDTLELSAKPKKEINIPNTFSVICHFYEGTAVIEGIGGCTGNALLGRFTLGDPKMLDIARQLAAIESNANPDILFFDVAYQAERAIDNVNRRACIYDLEFPIMSWSCAAEKMRITDLWVKVIAGEVVLWSSKHNKRVVPRVASSYNYTRSDLALYRFLCDLQHQSLHTDMMVDLARSFPGLDHYPRVVYKDIIVSPASWSIAKVDVVHLNDRTPPVDQIRCKLHNIGVTGKFLAGNGDQKLCFDPLIDLELLAFREYAIGVKHDRFMISEALVDPLGPVTNTRDQTYAGQFVLSLAHGRRVYDAPIVEESDLETIGTCFTPGEKWLYAEIYCHPLRSDQLLVDNISGFIERYQQHIDKWFFIRYNEPTAHIRLRLALKDAELWGSMVAALSTTIRSELDQGLVSDLQIKVYRPEIARYGKSRMPVVETIFHQNSIYILDLIRQQFGTEKLYLRTIHDLERLLDDTFNDQEEVLKFIKMMTLSFAKEFGLKKQDHKNINRLGASLLELSIQATPLLDSSFSDYRSSLGILMRTTGHGDRAKLLADILHMHINRLFPDDGRKHEMVVYELLGKYLLRRNALQLVQIDT